MFVINRYQNFNYLINDYSQAFNKQLYNIND